MGMTLSEVGSSKLTCRLHSHSLHIGHIRQNAHQLALYLSKHLSRGFFLRVPVTRCARTFDCQKFAFVLLGSPNSVSHNYTEH
ncbi:hypothetical protein U1Q18_052288, partial [Sarracenia purpurea var. burkii]